MGDREDRFREIFDVAYPALVAYARRRAPAGEVDDVVADALSVAWRRLDDVPPEAPLPWLYGVARNVVANRTRAERRRLALVGRVRAERPRDVEGADTSAPVLRALAALRREDREVLELAAWEGLGPSDLATVLGCSPNAAALRLSRARRRLREALTGSGTSRTGALAEGHDG